MYLYLDRFRLMVARKRHVDPNQMAPLAPRPTPPATSRNIVLRLRHGDAGLHIHIVVHHNFPFSGILYEDLQQPGS